MNAEFLKWWNNWHGDPSEIGLMQVALRAFERGAEIERDACARMITDASFGFCGGNAEIVMQSVASAIRERSNIK